MILKNRTITCSDCEKQIRKDVLDECIKEVAPTLKIKILDVFIEKMRKVLDDDIKGILCIKFYENKLFDIKQKRKALGILFFHAYILSIINIKNEIAIWLFLTLEVLFASMLIANYNNINEMLLLDDDDNDNGYVLDVLNDTKEEIMSKF